MVRPNAILCALMLLSAAPSSAQAPSAPPRSFTSSAEIEAMIVKAEATIKPDQANFVQPLLDFAPYRASLEYRQMGAGAAVHPDDAEYFQVIKGGGNLIEGGVLVDPTTIDARNLIAKSIVGGKSRHVVAGDVFVVLPGRPHQFDKVDGVLVMIAMKVPMPAPPPQASGTR